MVLSKAVFDLFSVYWRSFYFIKAIGLQYKFNTHEHQWFSTLPPIFIILIFKMVINDKFDNNFRWYNPTPGELKSAKVHSNRADAYGHRLEHRFGHPALHAELFTPMIHADMMPLLTEVEKGRIEEDVSRAKRGEYGGPPVTVQVVEGIKIDAVAKVRHLVRLGYPSMLTQAISE